MKNKCLFSSIAAVTLFSTGSFSLTLLTAFSPLTQSARAVSCNWSSSRPLPWNVNVRESKTTASNKIGIKPIGQILNFEAWEDGQAVQDAWDGHLDSKWFKLRGEPGWVASAVVPGYPPANCNPSTRLPNTISDANPFFKLQFNHPIYNPTGPNFSGNCGPASLAMILHALGKQPAGLTIQQSIDRASDLMNRPRNSGFTSWAQLQTGIRKAGGTPIDVYSWSELDQRLAAGQPVILNGYYGPNWRNQFPGSTGTGNVAHLNAALGKTSDGKYLIGDPMHRGGVAAMTRSQLAEFFTLQGQNRNPWGIAVTGL